MQTSQNQQIQDLNVTILTVNRYQTQQNAVFINFNREQIIESLKNYKTLDLYHRIALSKNIQSIRQICKDDVEYSRFLIDMAQDCAQIQTALIDFFDQLFKKQPIDFSYDIECLEPLKQLIKQAHLEIKEQSCTLLVQIIHRKSAEQRKQSINLILQLQEDARDQNKVIAIQLIAKLASDLTQSSVENYFTNHYTTIYNTQNIRLKKEIIYNLPLLANGVSSEFLDRQIIQNFYKIKCRQHMFNLRKACVQVISSLMALSKSKKQILATILLNFTIDQHQAVRTAAFKILPEFLAKINIQYPSSRRTELNLILKQSQTKALDTINKLFNLYINLIDNDINHFVSRENQIIEKVGFYFPGIIQNFGVEKWDSLKRVFERLLNFNSDQVKLPIVASIHQISKIIGPSIAKDFVFEYIVSLLKQCSQMLKQITVSHLSDFVQILPYQIRQNLIDIFLVFQNNPKEWRTRYKIALQLSHLAKIYKIEAVFKYIFPITLKLCNDVTAQVRFEAARHMYNVINKLNSHQQYQTMAILTVRELSSSNRYIQRQIFAFMIRFLDKLRLFSTQLIDTVIRLAEDKVSLVRVTLVLSIEQIIKHNPENHQLFQKAIDILKKDAEEDIAEHFL